MVKFLFFFSFFIILYSYIGYGLLIYLIVKLKRLFSRKTHPSAVNPPSPIFGGQRRQPPADFEPDVTLVVAAYNEADCITQKLRNSLDLEYPAGKLRWIFITDGSTDATADIIRRHTSVLLLHTT